MVIRIKKVLIGGVVMGLLGCAENSGSEIAENGEPDGQEETGTTPDTATDEGVATDTYPVEELCGEFDSIEARDGEYSVHNNVWGNDEGVGEQCIAVSDNRFEVTKSTHLSYSVASYPFILKGCHGDECTVDSGMPIAIADISSATFEWEVDYEVAGWFNVAYESWFSETGNSGWAAEMMIWLHRQGPVQPNGEVAYTVDLEGHTWEVWHDPEMWWNYVAYVATESIETVDFDLMPFIEDSIEHGIIEPDWYLDAMEAGFEIFADSAGLRVKRFSASVE